MDNVDSIEKFVKEELSTGRYESRDALIYEALRQMKERQAELKDIAHELRPGIEELQSGHPGHSFDTEAIIKNSTR